MSLPNPIPSIIHTVNPGISTGDTSIDIIDTGSDGNIAFITNNIRSFLIDPNQFIGVNTNKPNKRLTINESAGDCLRLINNNKLGTETVFADIGIDSIGVLNLSPTSGFVNIMNGIKLNNIAVTSTATQLNFVNVTAGTAQSNKALVLNALANVSGINSLTATTLNATSFVGTITTNAQPNITSLGTIINLKADGDSQFGNTTNGILSISADTQTIYLQPAISTSIGSSADLFIGNKGQTKLTSSKRFIFTAAGNLGINTYNPQKRLEINSIGGNHIRLVNGSADGLASSYVDFSATSTGDLTISSTGEQTITAANFVNITNHDGSAKGLQLNGILITATASQINYIKINTIGTAQASKALVLDSSSNIIAGVNSFSATAIVATNLTGQLLTAAQPNVTSLGIISNLKASGTIDLGDQTYVSGFLRITSSSQVLYLQPSLSNTVGSGIDLFIGNLNQTTTASSRKILFKSTGEVGINTTNPSRQVEINSISGNCLRLTYNDNDGNAVNYCDFNITSVGDLNIVPSNNNVAIPSHDGANYGLVLGSTLVTSTANELNYVNIATIGTAESSKAVVLDINRNITNINNITASGYFGTIQTVTQPNITSLGVLTELQISTTDSNNTVLYPMTITRTTNTAAAIGAGVGVNFNLKNILGNNITYGTIEVNSANVSASTEAGKFIIRLLNNGVMNVNYTFDNLGLFTAAASVSEGSDIRIKENIVNASKVDSYNKIMQINVKDYTLKKDRDKKIHRGIIAQELKTIIPNAVHICEMDEYNDFHSVENREIMYHLIQAVQYLAEQIEN